MSDKVKVAIRVRPYNRREIELKTINVVEVKDDQTILHHPDRKGDKSSRQSKVFAFDNCFWSFCESDSHYASQEVVYNELGVPILESSFQGYNACIFAYGQTGSGKSYTMMGSPNDKGLIPRLCDAIFERIALNKDPNVSFKVEVSYMEIYNEKVHDLLDPKGTKQNLKVREHNILGPYVDGLSTLAVSSFEEIDNLMTEGNKSRTVAATNMNSESSRSHAVFNIILTCSVYEPIAAVTGEKVSKMSLVDLAGSERAVKTGAIGDRLKEGSNINKSLTTLGLVISKLADQASGKSKEQFVPYRDSVLTWLLKDNLGGNSKTVMVATISPASDNYEETLSTLRYADRAKRIVNHAVVNEDPNARIIRELREEVEQLREQLKHATQQSDLNERLMESEKLFKEKTQTWEEKLRMTEKIHHERQQMLEKMGISVQGSGIKVEQGKYYLVNLNADPSLNELLVYYLKEKTLIGRPDAPAEQDIQLSGIGIQPEHCIIELDSSKNELQIIPFEGARTCVNGSLIKERTSLKHGDRILWGNNHFFRLNCPKSNQNNHSADNQNQEERPMDYEFAREELMMNELMNDPIQGAMKELEKQHEKDKFNALEQQKQMYEKQIQQLKLMTSPGTPYASYGLDSFGSTSGLSRASFGSFGNLSSPSQVNPRMERWAQEREKLFKKSLSKLKDEIVIANQLTYEANYLAREMNRNTEFKVTLQIPATNLSPNRRKGAFVSEPAILVKRTNKPSQIWSMEKLENKLVDMREAYQEWKDRDNDNSSSKSENSNELSTPDSDPFYELQENHHLIGVANIFLEVLFHDVMLDYQVPIINQQGEVAGRLHCEIGRIAGQIGERMADASDSYYNDNSSQHSNDSSDKNQIVVRIAIRSAKGLPKSLSNFVFCQYSFWNSNDSIVIPSEQDLINHREIDKVFRFDHANEFTIPITEEFLDHCADGALSIEVWGHRVSGFGNTSPEWDVKHVTDAQMEMCKSIADRWSELKRKIELWVEIQELNEQGEYSAVEVIARPDIATGGIYQLKQGQQRRISVSVVPVHDSGTLPVICEAITSLSIGCVCGRSKLQKALDSYQEEDLTLLREKWSEALTRRREYLDDQIKKLFNKQDKTKEDREREQSLIDQWVSLTEERNAVKCPAPGSGIPGAPADWEPQLGMETHIPVIFLDLNSDDMNLKMINDYEKVAGLNSILPKEHLEQFVNLPMIPVESDEISALAIWDSSMHNSQYLNRLTQPNERIYLILKVSVRLSHPAVMDLILRKRLAINIYKKQSITEKLFKRISRADTLSAAGITYEIVSCVPKASENPEDRETLALVAASDLDLKASDGESYIEKYTKGVSAVESILVLDKLRQQVATKELLAKKGRFTTNSSEALQNIRKTASVPNMAIIYGHQNATNSSTKINENKSDSAFDLSYYANSAYEGFDRIRQRANQYKNNILSGNSTSSSGQTQDSSLKLSNSQQNSKSSAPIDPIVKNTFGSAASTLSPAKLIKPMRTLIEEGTSKEDLHSDEEYPEETEDYDENEDLRCRLQDNLKVNTKLTVISDDEEGEEREEESLKEIHSISNDNYQNNISDGIQSKSTQSSFEISKTTDSQISKVCNSSTHENLNQLANLAGTPSALSSGYGSQPLLGTPLSSEDSISLHSNEVSQEDTTNNNSVIENKINGDSNSTKKVNGTNDLLDYEKNLLQVPENISDIDNDSNCSYDSRGNDGASVSDASSGPNELIFVLPNWLVLGESVKISPDLKTGVVAYIGKTHFASGIWVGIELDTPTGKNDGSVNGTFYFNCKPKHGIFVKPDKLKLDQRGRASRAAKLENQGNSIANTSLNQSKQSTTKSVKRR